ncbi:GNAT family N-acetyltransferase [Metabacillus sp. RGM 3146]|uniref:GNAT family N-acetyltransferase n=1 Tax=Metabacillus sp. RGM 3146 TaxID=3401092 RepID=UPI003B9A4D80
MNKLISSSQEWEQEEIGAKSVESYLKAYDMYDGEWLVWHKEDQPIGISYHMEWAPSNEKAWLGTILVEAGYRKKGYGKKIIDSIVNSLKAKGHKVVFAACPADRMNWVHFICHSGFEQLKIENSQDGKKYIILIRPV